MSYAERFILTFMKIAIHVIYINFLNVETCTSTVNLGNAKIKVFNTWGKNLLKSKCKLIRLTNTLMHYKKHVWKNHSLAPTIFSICPGEMQQNAEGRIPTNPGYQVACFREETGKAF